MIYHTALLWQKEVGDKSDISCKRANCVCHLHRDQWNIIIPYLTYLLPEWVYLCIKFGLEEEHIRWNMKTSITQIWMMCHLLLLAKVGQSCDGILWQLRTLCHLKSELTWFDLGIVSWLDLTWLGSCLDLTWLDLMMCLTWLDLTWAN